MAHLKDDRSFLLVVMCFVAANRLFAMILLHFGLIQPDRFAREMQLIIEVYQELSFPIAIDLIA